MRESVLYFWNGYPVSTLSLNVSLSVPRFQQGGNRGTVLRYELELIVYIISSELRKGLHASSRSLEGILRNLKSQPDQSVQLT